MKKAVLGILVVLAVGSDAFDFSSILSWFTPSSEVEFNEGLTLTFGMGLKSGKTFFIEMPLNDSQAVENGWAKTDKPENMSNIFKDCDMYCQPTTKTICIVYDLCAGPAGLLISLETANLTTPFDMKKVGFSEWNPTINNKTTPSWYITQSFVSPENQLKSCTERTAAYNSSKIVQNGKVYVSGFNGETVAISTNETEIEEEGVFTNQSCIPWMGKHRFYNMSKSLEKCTADTIFPWFTLFDAKSSHQMIGVSLVIIGKYTTGEDTLNMFEKPPVLAVEAIVPNRPTCLTEIIKTHGVITLHIYYLKKPTSIYC